MTMGRATSNSTSTVALFAVLWGLTFARVPPEELLNLDGTENLPSELNGMRVYLGPWGPCEALPSKDIGDTTTPYYYREKERNKINDTSRYLGHIGDFQQVNGGEVGGRARPHSLTFEPKVGQQRRTLECLSKTGIRLHISKCPNGLSASAGSVRACIVPEDCLLGEWSSWRPDASGGLVRTRALLNMPQGTGSPCGPLEERQPAEADGEVRWSGGPWGPCVVANASGYVPGEAFPPSDIMLDTSDMSGISSCGGGVQHRAVWCVRARDGLVVPDVRCAARQDVPHVSNVQPCEVPCPRDCEAGPWGAWSACRPLGECPLYPVQEVTSTGYSVRRRRVSVAGSTEGGASCGALAETRACPRPRCARWLPAAWGPCRLPAGASCGTGRRTRDIHCLDHDGRPAAESWCGAGGWATEETCRIACAGDCVLSAWGPWGACEGPCTKPHEEPPRRTRHRYVLAEASAKGWACPPPEHLEQSEPCNEHSCHTYSWITLPWSECEPIPNQNENEIESSTAVAAESCRSGAGAGADAGVERREVWCMQDNDIRVKDLFCVPLSKPHTQRDCSVRCAPLEAGCRVGPWGAWTPCPDTCETSTQSRTREVEDDCPVPTAQQRVCPPRCAAPPPAGAQWAVGEWRDCRLPASADPPCGVGIKTRMLWCSLGAHRVDARACLSAPAPAAAAPCRVSCDRGLTGTKYRKAVPSCDEVCNTTNSWGESWDALQDSGCKCPGFYLELLSPASDCILPPGERCGSGRRLQAAVCLGPRDSRDRPREFAACRRHVDTPVHPLSGLKYSDSIPGLVWRGCSVSCPRDCVLGTWSEWGDCRADRSNATYHYRTRSLISTPAAGGRPCGPLEQRRTCSVAPPRWAPGPWGACRGAAPKSERACGTGVQRRRVWCEDPSTGSERPLSACSSLGAPPPTVSPCRAPCPHDCVLSPWSDWSPCIKTSGSVGGLQRDRTRVVLRASRGSGRGCAALVEAAPCEVTFTYSWVLDAFDDCQPLGGSPCGEGTKSRSVRCVRGDGQHVDDNLCTAETRPVSSSLRTFCFIPCAVDCVVSSWGAWDKRQCSCGTDAAQLAQRMIRTRRVITSSSGEGRPCPDDAELRQTAPCPREPCFKATVKRLPECRLEMHDGSLALPEVAGACGHGVRVTEFRCNRVDGADGLRSSADDYDYSADTTAVRADSDSRAPRALCAVPQTGQLTSVPAERTLRPCVVPCGGSSGGDPCGLGAWGPWGACHAGVRERRRYTSPTTDARGLTQSAVRRRWNCMQRKPLAAYEIVEYANCSASGRNELGRPKISSGAPAMPEYGSNHFYIDRSFMYQYGGGAGGALELVVALAGLATGLAMMSCLYRLARFVHCKNNKCEEKLSKV